MSYWKANSVAATIVTISTWCTPFSPLCAVSLICKDSMGMAFSHSFASERDSRNGDRDLTEVPSALLKTLSAVNPVVCRLSSYGKGGTPKVFGLSYSLLHRFYILIVCQTSFRDWLNSSLAVTYATISFSIYSVFYATYYIFFLSFIFL